MKCCLPNFLQSHDSILPTSLQVCRCTELFCPVRARCQLCCSAPYTVICEAHTQWCRPVTPILSHSSCTFFQSSFSTCPVEPAGDHKHARRAELQSRAELHKARLDALNAKQHQTPSAGAKPSVQLGVSPMTQRAIADLTASQPAAVGRQSNIPAAAAVSRLAAAAAAALTKPSDAVQSAAAVNKPASKPTAVVSQAAPPAAAPGPSVSASANKADAVKPVAAARPAVTAASKDSKQQPQAAVTQSATLAAKRLGKQASSKDRGAVSPSGSRQAPKRRRSRSPSPSQGTGAGSKHSRVQAGSQRQAASSSHMRSTRYRQNLPCQC